MGKGVAACIGIGKADAYSALYAAVSKHNKVAKRIRGTERTEQTERARDNGHAKPIADPQYRSEIRVALLGHPYNIHDSFLNMNIPKKLAQLGVHVITETVVSESDINRESASLFKKPFWTLARHSYGAAKYLYKCGAIDGIVYISSFACGIDSVVVELIRGATEGLPFLVLKVDEHTGEAGVDTRIEAFTDLLRRRESFGSNISTYGEHISRGESAI